MDSLTQITLGAAVGELVLGKKIGNRALVWGAIGGTIPDLDVLSKFWMSEIDSLAFHRGITHSVLFAMVGSWVFAFLLHRYYKSGMREQRWMAYLSFMLGSLLLLSLSGGIIYLFREASSFVLFLVLSIHVGLLFLLILRLWRSHFTRPVTPVAASFRDWLSLFFWALLTHSLLDAFTSYGTQLFYPFTDWRVAFNVIAIVDPIYTLPFLGSLILAARLARDNPFRAKLVRFGLVWSTAYLVLCGINKLYIDQIFERSFISAGITPARYTTSPAIFSNILWQGVVESDSAFYLGTYSLFDSKASVVDFVKVAKTASDQEPEDSSVNILRWFSNGYYSLHTLPDGKYRFSDLRYGGIMGGDKKDPIEERFIFSFLLTPKSGGWLVEQIQPGDRDIKRVFAALWHRMKGHVSSL
jgi:inner membrane protein